MIGSVRTYEGIMVLTTKADEEPIRLSPDRIQNLKDRMRAASIAVEVSSPVLETITVDESCPIPVSPRLEYEARCAARAIIHEHTAYELECGVEWELALNVLDRPFDCDEYNFEDQLANSMLGIDYLLENRHRTK
jgi:hypothetical protein